MLNEFLEKVVKTVGLETDEGFIYVDKANGIMLSTDEGNLPLVIPTKDHLNTLVDEGGEMAKIPFNPLVEEYIVKEDSVSFIKMKRAVMSKLTYSLYKIGQNMFTLGLEENTPKAKLEVAKFLSTLKNTAANKNIKKPLDKNTIAKWNKLFDIFFSKKGPAPIRITSKRGGEIKDKTFNKTVSLDSPLLDELLEWKRGEEFHGIKNLSPKDVEVFTNFIKFAIKELEGNDALRIGSNDENCPGFTALIRLFYVVAIRFNKINKSCREANEDNYSEAEINLLIPKEELDFKKLAHIAKDLPNDRSRKFEKLEEEELSSDYFNNKEGGAKSWSDINGGEDRYTTPEREEDNDDGDVWSKLNQQYETGGGSRYRSPLDRSNENLLSRHSARDPYDYIDRRPSLYEEEVLPRRRPLYEEERLPSRRPLYEEERLPRRRPLYEEERLPRRRPMYEDDRYAETESRLDRYRRNSPSRGILSRYR